MKQFQPDVLLEVFSMHRKLILFIFSSVVSVALPLPAEASCVSASCPADMTSGRDRKAGDVELGYQFEYVEQDQHQIGRRSAAFREISGHHDEEFTVNRLHRLSVSAELTNRFGVDLKLPFVNRSHAHVVEGHQGGDRLASWDFSGLGDLALTVRYDFWKPENRRQPTLTAILGGEFPTGSYNEKNASGDVAELGIQPGSHSTDFIAGLASRQMFQAKQLTGGSGPLPFFISAIGQLNSAGTDDYRLGDTLQITAGTSYPVVPGLGFLAQLNFLLKDRDGKGSTDEEIQKTGGEFLYLSPGLEYYPAENWRVYALLQVPVYQRVNLIQTVSDYNLLFGATYRFHGLLGSRRSKG
jgi:hypothetical protein